MTKYNPVKQYPDTCICGHKGWWHGAGTEDCKIHLHNWESKITEGYRFPKFCSCKKFVKKICPKSTPSSTQK